MRFLPVKQAHSLQTYAKFAESSGFSRVLMGISIGFNIYLKSTIVILKFGLQYTAYITYSFLFQIGTAHQFFNRKAHNA